MSKTTPSHHRKLLVAALISAVVAFGLSLTGLVAGGQYAFGLELTTDGWNRFTRLLFDSAALLGGEPIDPGVSNNWFSWARVFAVMFAALAIVGIILELSVSAREFLLRIVWLRSLMRRKSVTIIGLGWIGGELAKKFAKIPAFGIEWDDRNLAIEEARRNKTIVITGDATDPEVRSRAGLNFASEIYVATGDDARNIEIAGGLMKDEEEGRIRPRPENRPLTCYVHVGDPVLYETVHDQKYFSSHEGKIRYLPFCTRALAAHDLFGDLFFNRNRGFFTSSSENHRNVDVRSSLRLAADGNYDVVPRAGEVLHLFVFGFGLSAQTVVLHAARYAHFSTFNRPRITVFGPAENAKRPWQDFLARCPSFAPPDLNLADPAFLDGSGDSWEARPSRPGTAEYQTFDPDAPETVLVDGQQDDTTSRKCVAIEYAANAEYEPLLGEIEDPNILDEIEKRMYPTSGPRVKPVFVMSLEEERESFKAGIRLQLALGRRLLGRPNESPYSKISARGQITSENGEQSSDSATKILAPIYVYLPVEEGLSELLRRRRRQVKLSELLSRRRRQVEHGDFDEHFPLFAFGEQRDVASKEAITCGQKSQFADNIRRLHAALSPYGEENHPDFKDSNLDAIRFAELRFEALGIRFLTLEEAREMGLKQRPLLDALYEADVEKEFRELRKSSADDGPLKLGPDEFSALSTALRERLALMGHVVTPKKKTDSTKKEYWVALEKMITEAVDSAIKRFADELEDANGAVAAVAGAMEHNRWMGERLSKGWKFGPRSNSQKQRESLVPWRCLNDDERRYDLQQLLRLILAKRNGDDPRYAYAIDEPLPIPSEVKEELLAHRSAPEQASS